MPKHGLSGGGGGAPPKKKMKTQANKCFLQSSATHISDTAMSEPGKGCVTKHGSSDSKGRHFAYRMNGKRYIFDQKKEGRAAYYTNKIGSGTVTADSFKDGLKYPRNYHHILPWAAFKNGLTTAQCDAVQASEYNINAGSNLIILPTQFIDSNVVGLPTHNDNHKSYSRDVASTVSGVTQYLSASPHPSQADLAQVKSYLETFERIEFPLIANSWPAKATVNDCPVASESNVLNEMNPGWFRWALNLLGLGR